MEETGGASAYGASLAGGGFDLQKFVRQPQTILRFLSWIFAIVVFACVTAEGYVNTHDSQQARCVFNQDDSACHYAVGVGVLAFLACVGFLVLDAYLPLMSSAQERKYSVLADLVFSGAWTFLWFVCFCLLASQWGRTLHVQGIPEEAARATIAFSFFSIATWGILTYFALGRYRRGVNDAAHNYPDGPAPPEQAAPYPPTYAPTTYAPAAYDAAPYDHSSYGPSAYAPTTYTPYPSGGADLPFVPQAQPQGDVGYQPPSY